MSFDVNNPAHLLILKTEEETDPAGVGYAAALGNTHVLLDLFNLPANNPGPETGIDFLTAEACLLAIFGVSISSQDQFKIQLLFEGSESLQSDLSDFRLQIRGLSAPILAAIDTIIRPLSRVEVVFADLDINGVMERVVISRNDWIAARDS